MAKFHGDFVYKQGRLDLASGLQLARLSKCVVPDSELQGQLSTDVQAPSRPAAQQCWEEAGQGVTAPILRRVQGGPAHPFLSLFLPPFPLSDPRYCLS